MLTALELAGFKSFADKTRLEFPAGVTCVVGPNGSGKSNVVDAIKWVMGSQSPKSLRGGEMTDVIFNGSAARRPLNAAEVTLEFDNRGKLFELNHDVVRITRRVYRSGEGEYAINGTACRLKDIRELLAGTGAGTESYSIIEQGRVDAVLRSSPKDRRTLFEEAAGISRFRLKKQEATRRLARVEQNLLRLSDIVDEVEGRLRRVRMQAGKAKRYREQADRLQLLRTQLGLADWWSLSTRLEQVNQTVVQAETAATELRTAIEAAEKRDARHEQQSAATADQLATAQRSVATLRERIVARQAFVAAETKRHNELAEQLTHTRRSKVATQIDAAVRDDGPNPADLCRNLAEAEEACARAREELQNSENRHREALERSSSLKQERKNLETARDELKTQLQRHTREFDQLEAREELGHAQEADSKQQLQRLAEQLAATEHELTASEKSTADLSSRVQTVSTALKGATAQVEALRRRLDNQRRELGAIEADARANQHRLTLLEEGETRLERLKTDIGKLLAPADDADAPPAVVRGLVADLMHVDFDTAPMIEAALGDRAHHLVIDNGEGLIEAFAANKAALTTRASFQRLDCRTAGSAVDRIDIANEPGVMGRADRFVGAEPEYAALVSRLLGRTWLVDTVETAQRLATTTGRGLSFVTFAGECFHADGTITIGATGETDGLLTRRKQADRLRDAIETGDRRAKSIAAAIAAGSQQADAAEAELSGAAEEHAALVTRLADSRAQTAKLTERRERLESESRRLRESHSRQQGAAESVRGRREEVARLVAQATADTAAAVSQQESLTAAAAAAERALGEQAAAVTEARVELAKQEQHAEILAAQVEQIQRTSSQQGAAEAEAIEALKLAEARLCESRQSLLDAGTDLAEIYLKYDHRSAELRSLAALQRSSQREHRQTAKSLAEARRRLDRVHAEQQRSSLEADRLRLELGTLADRMQEDYGIDLAQAAQEAGPPAEADSDRTALEREVATLRGEVNTIGAINLDSLEELDELEDRFAELSSQYRDLADAKASLEKLSSRISAESRQLFLTTVEEVRGHFRELFRRLFGGGEADIVLMEEEDGDPLDAGVDIAACPPGKELRSISLMSGGEKTMTCVALLLAVFRTKPSPFCVLDEVDAALDEANIGRFTGVLSEFLSSTQFIVVTHSKKTMTGADTLYGVTMQESGISKQVAVRFEDVGEDGQIDAAATLRRAA